MKKLLTLFFAAFVLTSNAQIIFDNYYQYANNYTDGIRLVKLSSAGYKYVTNNKDSLSLYNLNHTHYLTINIPSLTPPVNSSYPYVSIWYVSDELFNTNSSDIEYLLYYLDNSSVEHCKVYDQVGNMLFSKDSVVFSGGQATGNENFISYTPSGVKVILENNYIHGTFVYSLPGTLPCHDCTNGTITSITTSNTDSNSERISNYPNPTTGQTTIEYNLPLGHTTADIVFYKITGQEVRRFKVTNAFHNILISTADLEAGTYFYQLQTADGSKCGRKMVVVK